MKCELCGSDRRDSIRYGEFLIKNGKGVHTNCLYLSSGIVQNGKDEEGFLGFLPNDIAAERKRVSTIKCFYCGEKMANVGCCQKRCNRSFHMICGIENGAMNQFIDTFRSFCHRHVSKVNYRPKKDDACCICYEKIFNESTRFNAVKMIRAPCCRNGWFHNYCLQQFAKNAGYFFKCPLCNDTTKFKRNMSLWGIFVQNKDAEWELVPNAYAELLERPNVCAAKTCHNPKGRAHQANSNSFLYCVTCGSVAIHKLCAPQRSHSFECDNCKSILHADSGRESMSSQQLCVSQSDGQGVDISEDENFDVDVCGSASEDENDCDVIKRTNFKRMYSLQKLRILDDFDDNTFDSKSSIHSKDAVQKTGTATFSEDEGPVNVVKEKIEEIEDCDVNTLTLNTSINNAEDECVDISDGPNVSCIAQRTRRKSAVTCLPPIDDQEGTDDDSKSTSSYKSSNCCQVFHYDEDSAVTDNTKSKEAYSTEENDLDISCIAKRTRRRFLNKSEPQTDGESGTDNNSMDKHSPDQTSSTFKYHVCQDTDSGNLQLNKCEEQNSYGNCSNGFMNYFFQLLDEVKRNSQKMLEETKNSKEEYGDETKGKTVPSNTSGIAKSTRRRINSVNVIDDIKEVYVETEDQKSAANNNGSFVNSTANLHCHQAEDASKVKKTASRKRSHDIATAHLKGDLTASIPPKIPATFKNKSKNESVTVVTFDNDYGAGAATGEENISEQNCIANRTRRKSMDVKHSDINTNVAKRKKRFVSVDERALNNCKNRALTPNNNQAEAIRRGERSRLPAHHTIENDTHKSMLGHSPTVKYANWAYIKDTTVAYIKPKNVRASGKLRNENAQQLQCKPAAQTHFARSYQLLLECNENHFASTSASAQRV